VSTETLLDVGQGRRKLYLLPVTYLDKIRKVSLCKPVELYDNILHPLREGFECCMCVLGVYSEGLDGRHYPALEGSE
jgi:hypothetical protein